MLLFFEKAKIVGKDYVLKYTKGRTAKVLRGGIGRRPMPAHPGGQSDSYASTVKRKG